MPNAKPWEGSGRAQHTGTLCTHDSLAYNAKVLPKVHRLSANYVFSIVLSLCFVVALHCVDLYVGSRWPNHTVGNQEPVLHISLSSSVI